MIYDTDVLVWVLRGDDKATRLVDSDPAPALSVVTSMELLRGARNVEEVGRLRRFLAAFQPLPLTENIGHRAVILVEQFGLATSIEPTDALIAATALELELDLCTGNAKHFRKIQGLRLKVFRHTA